MERAYRRRNEGAEAEEKLNINRVRRISSCILLFAAVMFIKTSKAGELDFARQCIDYTVSASTDFRQLYKETSELISKSFFSGEQEAFQNDDLEPLAHMCAPAMGTVVSKFGLRTDPFDKTERFHYGIDISGNENDKILCVQSGTAAETGESEEYGKYILVKHSQKIYTLYAHCNEILAKKDDTIKKGQTIALMGSTGKTTGTHLHFEIREDDNYLNPEEFVKVNGE